MADISASLVKQLRERTGAGNDGVQDALSKRREIREAGNRAAQARHASAGKKASRMTKQGTLVPTSRRRRSGCAGGGQLRVDFVPARRFSRAGADIALHIAAAGPAVRAQGSVTAAAIAKEKDTSARRA